MQTTELCVATRYTEKYSTEFASVTGRGIALVICDMKQVKFVSCVAFQRNNPPNPKFCVRATRRILIDKLQEGMLVLLDGGDLFLDRAKSF